MNTFTCATRYFTRRKIRSIILSLILCILSVLILTVFSITTAANSYLNQLQANFSSEFIIDARKSPGTLTLENMEQLYQREDIAGCRSISNQIPVCFADKNGVPLQVKTDGERCLVSPGFEHAGTLISNINSRLDKLFEDRTFELVSGRHLTGQNTQSILIHQDLAAKNNLTLGDNIQLAFPDAVIDDLNTQSYDTAKMTCQITSLEITGIFRTTGSTAIPSDSAELQLSHQLYENYSYIDLSTYAALFSESNSYYNQAAFSVAASADLAATVSEIKQLDWIARSSSSIHSDLDDYRTTSDALTALSGYLKGSMILIIPFAFLLLYLVLSNGLRQRSHEIGVFLVLGKSKSRILLQHIAEVFLAAACGFPPAVLLSRELVQQAGRHLLMNNLNITEPITMALCPEAIWITLLIEALLIPFSVLAAGYKIAKKRPHDILKSLS